MRRDKICLCACLLLCAKGLLLQAADYSHGDFAHRDFFPILPWSPFHNWDGAAKDIEPHGLDSIAECGFNMAGFVRPEDLPECEKLGLGAIMFPAAEGLPQRYHRVWRRLSDEQMIFR
jgi:hypothetical protein